MSLHYAQTLSTVAGQEFLRHKKVTADGREYQRDPAEIFEALALSVRREDGTIVPLRGAGAPQQRIGGQPGHDRGSDS